MTDEDIGTAKVPLRPVPEAPYRFVLRTRTDGRGGMGILWEQIEEAVKHLDVVIFAASSGATDEGNCPCCNQPSWEID